MVSASGHAGDQCVTLSTSHVMAKRDRTVPFIGPIGRSGLVPALKPFARASREFIAYGTRAYEQFKAGGSADVGIKNNLLNSLHQASLKDPAIDTRAISTEAGAIMVRLACVSSESRLRNETGGRLRHHFNRCIHRLLNTWQL